MMSAADDPSVGASEWQHDDDAFSTVLLQVRSDIDRLCEIGSARIVLAELTYLRTQLQAISGLD